MQSDMYYDAVIAGCGVAGLYTALNLPDTMRILMVCKGDMEECDSMLAQGGICVLPDEKIILPILKIPCVQAIMKITERVLTS